MQNGRSTTWGTFPEAYGGNEETLEISSAATFAVRTGIWTREFQDAHQYDKESSSTCTWDANVSSRLALFVVGCTEFVVAGLNTEPMTQYNTVLVEFVYKLPTDLYIHLTPCFPLKWNNPQNSVVNVCNPGSIPEENGVWRSVTFINNTDNQLDATITAY